MSGPNAYPLAWPQGRARQGSRKASSTFRTQLPGALKNVRDSLSRFAQDSGKAISGIVISSNVTLGINRPDDGGVAVYFQWDGQSVAIAVDRYAKVECNLQAIHHILEARRTELRHGGLEIVRAAFTGFKALPAPRSDRDWWSVLEISRDADASGIRAAAKRLAKIHHPDVGGNASRMAQINQARDIALSELGAS